MTGEGWTSPAFVDFEEPPAPKKGKKKPKKDVEPPKPPAIVKLPDREPAMKSTEVVRGLSQRAKACVNMRLEGASFMEIADFLEYETPQDARRDCERALAATHPPEDWETLRQVATARAEGLFQQSYRMARADFLVDQDGNQVPNVDKRGWHNQAAQDLMNHAIISGAKAPAKLEVTPGEAALDRLADKMLKRGGYTVTEEAEALELTVIPHEEGDDGPDIYA